MRWECELSKPEGRSRPLLDPHLPKARYPHAALFAKIYVQENFGFSQNFGFQTKRKKKFFLNASPNFRNLIEKDMKHRTSDDAPDNAPNIPQICTRWCPRHAPLNASVYAGLNDYWWVWDGNFWKHLRAYNGKVIIRDLSCKLWNTQAKPAWQIGKKACMPLYIRLLFLDHTGPSSKAFCAYMTD